jgi:hypothetical protein
MLGRQTRAQAEAARLDARAAELEKVAAAGQPHYGSEFHAERAALARARAREYRSGGQYLPEPPEPEREAGQ